MNLHLSHPARWALAGIAALALALLVSCGGGDESTTLTAEQAQTIADAALLVRIDLPEGDWTQEEAQASLAELLPADTNLGVDTVDVPEACQAFQAVMGDLPATLGEIQPLASSGRSYSNVGDTLSAQIVSSTVLVFEHSEDAAAAGDALQTAFDSDGIEDCMLSALGPVSEAGIEIKEFRVDKPEYALADSTGLHIQVDAVAFILPIQLGIDLHIFSRGNALAMYMALELNGDDLESLHGELLKTFAARIEDAQK